MNNVPHSITVSTYDYDTGERKVVVEDLSIWLLAKSLTPEHLAALLDDFLNSFNNPFRTGETVGEKFLATHRTIQGCFVNFLLGCLAGISNEEYTDLRNQTAIAAAKEVKRLLDEGKLPIQPFI